MNTRLDTSAITVDTQDRVAASGNPDSVNSGWPEAGPADQLSVRRLRQSMICYFGEVRALDEHLDLLDARGVLYAQLAMDTWSVERPGSFIGLVRHVVRTQFDGPAPDPDIEGWLAAGRPDDAELGPIWDWIRTERYDPRDLDKRCPIVARHDVAVGSVARMDEILRAWPDGCLEDFVFSYVEMARVLERRELVVPLPSVVG